jgi:hypothetical protein
VGGVFTWRVGRSGGIVSYPIRVEKADMQLTITAACIVVALRAQNYCDELPRPWDRVSSLRVVVQAHGSRAAGEISRLRNALRISSEGAIYFEQAHGDESSWQSDLNRRKLFLKNGVITEEVSSRRVAVEYPFNRSAIDGVERYPLWAMLGWWPDGFPFECPRMHGSPTSLLDVINESEQTTIERSGDYIIVSTPRESVELSLSHGLAIAQRIWFDADTRRPITTMVADDFVEIAPGIWLPWAFRVLWHDPERSSEVRTVTFQVTEAGVNDATASDFIFKPSPGTYLVNADGSRDGRQIEPGGFDLMLAFVRLIRSRTPKGDDTDRVVALGIIAGILTYLLVARYICARPQ